MDAQDKQLDTPTIILKDKLKSLFRITVMFWICRRKPEYLEKNRTCTSRRCRIALERPQSRLESRAFVLQISCATNCSDMFINSPELVICEDSYIQFGIHLKLDVNPGIALHHIFNILYLIFLFFWKYYFENKSPLHVS